MPITDNRVQLTDAEAIAPGGFPGEFVDEVGGSMTLNLDTDTFIEGISSIADQSSNNRIGILWQEDADRDWTDSVFYIWWNCVVANKLGLKNAGGVTMRFTGATVTDWFEVFIEGSNTYGGGYKMSVVDIEEARAAAITGAAQSPNLVGNTGGTPPETSAIRRVGIMWETTSNSPGSSDNCFIDAIWRLPFGEPGVIVSGENTAVSPIRPYNWDDVLDAGDNSDTTKAWGVISEESGVIFLNTPVQFGNNGSPDDGDHDFEDTNKVIAWESQLVADSFYGLSTVGDSTNTQRFIAGVKSGTGDDATGTQGWVVLAASDGPRWFIDCADPENEDTQWQGCSLSHSSFIDIDNANVEMRSTQLLDGQRIWHSRSASPRSGADFQRNNIITADPITFDESPVIGSPANVSYIWTADPDKLKFNTFNYFTGHAINVTEAGTFEFEGNVFDSLWNAANSPNGDGTIEAALYTNKANGVKTMNITDGDTPTTFPAVVVVAINGDDFNRSTGLGSNWETIIGPHLAGAAPVIYEDMYFTNGAPNTQSGAVYTADGFVGGAQFAEATIADWPVNKQQAGEAGTGVGVYYNGAGGSPLSDGFALYMRGDLGGSPQDLVLQLQATNNNSLDGVVASDTLVDFTPQAGDILRLEVIDNFFSAFYNGVLRFQYDDTVRQFGDGMPALYADESGNTSPSNNVLWDDFSFGSLSQFTINNNVSVTLTNIIPGTEIRVYPVESPLNTTEIAGVESVGSPNEFTFSGAAGLVVDIVVFHIDYVLPPANRFRFTIPNSSTSFPLAQVIDRTYNNP